MSMVVVWCGRPVHFAMTCGTSTKVKQIMERIQDIVYYALGSPKLEMQASAVGTCSGLTRSYCTR